MKFSESWLRTWVNPALSTAQLAERLTMTGLEVEACEPAAPAFSGVVVAQVLTVRKHENAEKLNICTVDAGQGEPLQIVCGASNVVPGIKVPCAMVGAVLPGDFHIKAARLRGVESFGMLCSARELGVSEDGEGLMILPVDAPVGADFRAYAQLDDQLLTLKLTPNRADCLSLRGIAREVAALTGSPVTPPVIAPATVTHDVQQSVRLDAPAACPRYAGRVIRGVNAAALTPDWMLRRLARSGIRSISALVDITNYVLLELGQPMHAFDHGRLSGEVVVRFAQPGEALALLNGKTLELDADMLVIADASGPLALAGIMGGEASAVSVETTRDVFLESAYFDPKTIAGKSRRIGFGSDSSHRFERGVDFACVREALERATALVLEICGGAAGPVTEVVASLPVRRPVKLRTARVARVLGITLSTAEIANLLQRLGLPLTVAGEVIEVTPPSYRFDLELEADLIEEVARLYGYDQIPTRPPVAPQAMLPQPGDQRTVFSLKQRLAGRDYQEVITYAFVEAAWERDFATNATPVRLLNPIASQLSVMRSTLIGGLVQTLAANLARKQERVRVFELARVFHGIAADQQPEQLAGLAYGARAAEQWGESSRRIDFYDVKADVEALLAPRRARFVAAAHPALHPGRCAEVWLDEVRVGVMGELHPKWVQAYGLPHAPVLFELVLAALTRQPLVRAQPVSRLQPVRRDLALVVDDAVPHDALLECLTAAAPTIVTELVCFDLYRGKGVPEGKKSLAFKVILQDTARTLTDTEVDSVVAQLVAAAQQRYAAQLRA
jgi:phenylalanyl-tRNA synthetase beta chain